MFKQSKEQEKKGSEKREVLLVSFLNVAHFVFAIIRVPRYIGMMTVRGVAAAFPNPGNSTTKIPKANGSR